MQEADSKVDAESLKFLQEVKKGLVRKFVMIKEGVQIDKLYVFKKGPYKRRIRQARQEGIRGEAFWGVIEGDGLDLHFVLSRADGFNEAPGKELLLREFLHCETGMKLKPDYVLVDSLSVEEEVGESEHDGDKFISLLKRILPHVKKALNTPTPLREELQLRVSEAQELGRAREFEQGLETLRVVGRLTKQALAESQTALSSSASESEFTQRWQQLRPRLDQALAANTSVTEELSSLVADAEQLADRGWSSHANRALNRIERLVPVALWEIAKHQQWEQRLADLEPRCATAVEEGDPCASQVAAVLDYARDQAGKGKYAKALVGCSRLESILTES